MNKKQPKAYVICGFIGAGKTTFARKLENETGVIRITKDEWVIKIFGNKITADKNFEVYDKNVTKLARDISFKILESGGDVIIDEGFWEKSQRDEMKKKIFSIGAKPIFYYVECPVKKMRERVVSRSKNPSIDSFEISGEMFDSYLKYWQAPDGSEHIIVIKSSELC
ncbi:MAG: AAA family ATPase [Candidatus Levybacteria bacterium]|nr:AAA family ATPase [Candidatus Levybacteria bacterium]